MIFIFSVFHVVSEYRNGHANQVDIKAGNAPVQGEIP